MKPAPTKCPPALKLPLLISYAYLREETEASIERIVTDPKVELLVDSGAFTALNAGSEISLDEYIEFCLRWKAHLFGYMALDKIGDPKKTAANLRVMLGAGLKPIPVHVLGDGQRKMDELFELSDWVACGGLRRPHRGPASLSYVKQKMEWARGRRVHWLGFTEKRMLQAFKPYSCDCSSWAGGMMFGRVDVYHGGGRWSQLLLDDVRAMRGNLPADLRAALRFYDVPLSEFLDADHWHNGNSSAGLPAEVCVISKLPARSWARYVLEFKQRFGVRIFIASNSGQAPWLINAHAQVLGKLQHENHNLRHAPLRGLPQVAGSSSCSGIPQTQTPARLSRPRREGGVA